MRAESHHQVKSGDWAEVGGTLLMWESARREEGKGRFHGWGGAWRTVLVRDLEK